MLCTRESDPYGDVLLLAHKESHPLSAQYSHSSQYTRCRSITDTPYVCYLSWLLNNCDYIFHFPGGILTSVACWAIGRQYWPWIRLTLPTPSRLRSALYRGPLNALSGVETSIETNMHTIAITKNTCSIDVSKATYGHGSLSTHVNIVFSSSFRV